MDQAPLAVFDGPKMREARAKRKLTRRQLAERLGLTVEALRQFELGIATPLLATMRRIEDALRLRPGALVKR